MNHKQQTFACEMDYPPGFGPIDGICTQSPSEAAESFSFAAAASPKQTGPSYLNKVSDDMINILESVESALHLSSNISSFEYFEEFIKMEVAKLFNSEIEDEMIEVT